MLVAGEAPKADAHFPRQERSDADLKHSSFEAMS